MRDFKIIEIVFIVLAILACSNGQSPEIKNQPENRSNKVENQNNVETIEQMFQKSLQGIESTKYHEFIDPNNGLVQARYPIPKSWKINALDNPIYVEGPDHLRVYKTETQAFAWSNDPIMRETIQMSGQRLAQPLNIKQILTQFVRQTPKPMGTGF